MLETVVQYFPCLFVDKFYYKYVSFYFSLSTEKYSSNAGFFDGNNTKHFLKILNQNSVCSFILDLLDNDMLLNSSGSTKPLCEDTVSVNSWLILGSCFVTEFFIQFLIKIIQPISKHIFLYKKLGIIINFSFTSREQQGKKLSVTIGQTASRVPARTARET